MDYTRKKHWVTYHSKKCKMYLRNDFRFECAYCGMREQDNVAGEFYFEKDHYVSKESDVEWNTDAYENMVYACRKCNKTKSDKELSLTLDPCKDDIYNGEHPQIEKHGEEDHYAVRAQTEKGRRFIENLELNSKFYRRMRKEQQEGQKIRAEISKILKADFEKTMPKETAALKKKLEKYFGLTERDESSDEFRCGETQAGKEMYEILKKLREKKIPCRLLLDEHDADIVLSYEGREYDCEIKSSETEGKKIYGPVIKKEKLEAWNKSNKQHGVLYDYRKKNKLVLYIWDAEGKRMQCEL